MYGKYWYGSIITAYQRVIKRHVTFLKGKCCTRCWLQLILQFLNFFHLSFHPEKNLSKEIEWLLEILRGF